MDTRPIQAALTQLHYDWHNFSIDDFTRHVAHQRQRELHLQGFPLKTREFSGLCVVTPRGDHLFFDVTQHHIIQQHTLLHELAHLVLKHSHMPLHLHDIQDLAPILHLRSEQHRAESQEETEAEIFAFLVQQAAVESRRRKRANQTDHAADMYILPFSGNFFKDS
jgi:hypothetical protein